MIKRRGFLGGLIAAIFSPAIAAKPAAFDVAKAAALDLPPAVPLHFGNMVWKPELTLVQPMVRKVVPGLVEAPAGFVVQPMFKHLTALPIVGMLNVTGDNYPSSKAPYVPTVVDSDAPLDWMDFEMISWRDENGNLTNPPDDWTPGQGWWR